MIRPNSSSPANSPPVALQDLTGDVTFDVADPNVARVTSAGRVIPLANGSTEITASYGDKSVKVAVKNDSMDVNLPINFGNQIVPIFTKLGCNCGGCHGKAGGQNGFNLSLLGFEPELDYQTLVKEDRGRRLFPAAPGQQPAAAQGDRRHGPRRRQAHGGRLRRVQARPPLDRLRHALRQARRTRSSPRSPSTPNTAS